MVDGLSFGWRQRAAEWAAGKERIHELHLFGSRAKGGFLKNSDVDLAYVLTGGDPGEVLAYAMFEAITWERELIDALGASVDLQMADPSTDQIVWPAVEEHGQMIYRKKDYLPVI